MRFQRKLPIKRYKNRAGNPTALVFLACILLLSGCAGLGFGGSTPEAQVKKRAQGWLDALMAWDLEKALAYTAPAYRQRVSREQYGSRFVGVRNWTKASIQSVSCEPERCDVRIFVRYQMKRPKVENERPIDYVWIKLDGKWYIYHK